VGKAMKEKAKPAITTTPAAKPSIISIILTALVMPTTQKIVRKMDRGRLEINSILILYRIKMMLAMNCPKSFTL
jgi:hypothetical protein